jgi:endonuclease V-like protein UPF0215 family
MVFFTMQEKIIKEQDRILGNIIKKSIDLYLSKKPIIISYNKKGKVTRKHYNRQDFAKDLNVSVRAIKNWQNTSKINKFTKIKLVRMGIIPKSIW